MDHGGGVETINAVATRDADEQGIMAPAPRCRSSSTW